MSPAGIKTDKKGMRILVLVHEYPPVGGGGGSVAEQICTGLTCRGHQVYLLTSGLENLPTRQVYPDFTIQRLKPARRQAYRTSFIEMLMYVIASTWHGFWLIRSWKPDLIHVHFAVPAGAAAWVLSKLSGVPYVLSTHLGDVPGGVPEKTAGWFRWIYPFTPPIWRSAARVVAVSEYTHSLASKVYPVDIRVIPNGVDLQRLNPASIQVGFPPRILFAGRFTAQKNLHQLVQSLAALRDVPWQCTLIGDGELRPAIEDEISRQGLQERITLCGWLSPEEVLAHFAQGDILFMPSLSEGLSVVGLQALAMGLALVLSRVGGNVELVQPGENGSLIDPLDPAGYVDALRALLNDPLRLLAARRVSRRLATRFDLNKVVDEYEKLFQEVCRS